MIEMTSVLPAKDATSEPWFQALKEGKLLIQRDPVSGKPQFYPRARIAGHPDRVPEWAEASGRATLYSWTVVERTVHPQFVELAPFTIAIVDLEEGVRMTSWLVDVPAEQIRCDMPLKVVFREIHVGEIFPCFTVA